MDLQSPLSQQVRPIVFKPKVVELYEILFQDEHGDLSEGFWREFFLLKPDASSLRSILTSIDAEELVHVHQNSSQQLLVRACEHISNGTSPSDEIALDTLTVFLDCVLNKRYTSPSSDIIAVLAGLEDVDSVFSGFVVALDEAMRDKRQLDIRHKAVKVAISAVSGAFQTGLVSYFINRDLFTSITKLLLDTQDAGISIHSLVLLTLLINYNRFEFQNPYQIRLEDLAGTSIINAMISCIGSASSVCRDRYSAVQEDQPEGGILGDTLSWLGLGSLTRRPQIMQKAMTDEIADKILAILPPPEATVLLSAYDAVSANKIFRLNFVSPRPDKKQDIYPFAKFLSLSSYLFQYTQQSAQAALYARLNLLTLQALLNDVEVAGRLCSSECAATIRLCRQRHPVLPMVRDDRGLAAVVLDAVVSGMDHNIIPLLDDELFHLFLCVILRAISFLTQTRTRLVYHWSELWRSLFNLVTHMTANANSSPSTNPLVSTLAQILALSLLLGDSFISDSISHDDLFYRIYTSHSTLLQFRSTYLYTATPAMEMLIKTSAHCKTVLEQHKASTGKAAGNPKEIGKVLRQSFESEGFGGGESLRQVEDVGAYREVEWRGVLKKIARGVVQDAKDLLGRGT